MRKILNQIFTQDKNVLNSPVKVLFVENGAGFGGAIVALETLVNNFKKMNIDCHIITNSSLNHFSQVYGVKSISLVNDRRYYNHGLVAKIKHKIENQWLKNTMLFLLGRYDDIINRFPYFMKLIFAIIRFRPDIIHGNNELVSNREAMLAAVVLRIPYVQHIRGPVSSSRLNGWLLGKPDIFIPVSQWLARDLRFHGAPADRIKQIYDGIEIPDLPSCSSLKKLHEEFSISNNNVIVAMIGMMVPWKGQAIFIEAVRLVGQQLKKPITYLIIGDSPEFGDKQYENSLRQRAIDCELEEVLMFTGRRNDLVEILPEIDVVVSASTEPEPLGLVMLEAMASGCVFVGPSFGAAIEVVMDGKNGFLFEPSSVVSLSKSLISAVECVANNWLNREEMRDMIVEKFNAEKCSNSTETIYKNLLLSPS